MRTKERRATSLWLECPGCQGLGAIDDPEE